MITSSRSSSARVAEWRIRSIASFTELSFSIYVSDRGDIGLGLVIVVIADEILDRVLGKELLELAIELGREDLVGREDQRGALQLLDDLGHGEGLARPGDAEQHLVALARRRLFDELANRGRLVARRLVIADQLESLAALGLGRARGAVGDKAARGFGFGKTGADFDGHADDMGAGS